MAPLWVDYRKDEKENDRSWKAGELQSRLKGSSHQEPAEERKMEGGIVDCHVTGSCVRTLDPYLGVLFWENFKR